MKRIFLYAVIPIILFIFGAFAALIFNSISFSTLSYSHATNIENTYLTSDVKTDKIFGTFVADEDNLAIIRINFGKFTQMHISGGDLVTFRIKEYNSNDWSHINNYHIGNTKHNPDFLIGFPPISDSKNKKYFFELIPYDQSGINTLAISGSNPKFEAIYKFDSHVLFSNFPLLSIFMLKKIYLSFTNIDFLLSSLVYFLPLFFYLVLMLMKSGKIKNRFAYSYLIILLTISDIVFIPDLYVGIYVSLLVLWLVVSALNRLGSQITFALSFVLICIQTGLIYLNMRSGQESLGIYIYGLLVIGVIQLLYEFKSNTKLVGLKEYVSVWEGEKKRFQKYTYGDVFSSASELFRKELYKYAQVEKKFKNRKVLDLGCGFGPDSINFAKYAKSVVGVDSEFHKSWNTLKHKNTKFIKAKSESLPFKDHEFDGVFLKDLLHHVSNVNKTMKEIKRVSSDNAIIIIIEGNRYNPLFYIYATKLNKHNHFTQGEFRKIILKYFPNARFKHHEIYPPFLMNAAVYKYFVWIYNKINIFTLFQPLFSYNIAVISGNAKKDEKL